MLASSDQSGLKSRLQKKDETRTTCLAKKKPARSATGGDGAVIWPNNSKNIFLDYYHYHLVPLVKRGHLTKEYMV
jgi:hypothetical protein